MRGMAGSRLAGFMPLSDLQQRVAEIVFALDESEGFALAGGGALIAHDVVDRTTRDLDCFGPSRDAVDRYWPAIVGALQVAGFAVDVRVADHGFAKMTVSDPVTGDVTQVDVGFDPAGKAAVAMLFGVCGRSMIWLRTSSSRCSAGLRRATSLTCRRCAAGSRVAS